MSQDGKTADLTIHHGRTVQPSKSNPFPLHPQTTHTINAAHARHFPVGAPVKMTLSTAPDSENDDDATGSSSSSIGAGYARGVAKG